jgi:hypothetical protein
MRFLLGWAHRRRPQEEFDALLTDALAAQADAAQRQEVQTMSQSMAEWIAEQSRAEGRAEGQLQQAQADLQDLLTDRFGSLPAEVIQRIEATTDVARLRACLRQVARMTTLADLPL